MHVYEVRLRKDKRSVDLIADAVPFGRRCYGDPNAINNVIGYAEFFTLSHDAMIRVYDAAGNVIETREHKAVHGVGRGSGVGRGLGVGVGLGVEVALGVAVGVTVGVGVTDGVGVGPPPTKLNLPMRVCQSPFWAYWLICQKSMPLEGSTSVLV